MTTAPFFDARIIANAILAILIRGSLDSTTTEEFDREIQKHLDEGRSKIIIDCRYLDGLSSVAIGRLVVLQTRLRRKGGAVKLATIHGPVAEVIKVIALGNILDIYDDLKFARKSFYN